MKSNIPKILFVGAGNIAQSVMKGIIRTSPGAAKKILATAPSDSNLREFRALGCQTVLLHEVTEHLENFFEPELTLLCIKPQVLSSVGNDSSKDLTRLFAKIKRLDCLILSFISGINCCNIGDFNIDRIVRVMLNTASEINASNILYYHSHKLHESQTIQLSEFFNSIGSSAIRVQNESLMDVATGICGSGIAFFYEMIQATSDIGVKNGLSRADSLAVATQLSIAAGQMIIKKNEHPYKLRDDVTSPLGTTIHGLSAWHERSVNQGIANAFQNAIDRAKSLAKQLSS